MAAPAYTSPLGGGPRPLDGVRVVSIATNVPGPVAVARLVALGASATKVEPPSGDYLAFAARGWYEALSAGIAVVRLDLKDEAGRAQLMVLLADADIFITSHRPRALERLGLAPADVQARCPRLCFVRILGHAAPDGDVAGHDLTYQAEAGLVAPPQLPPALFVDVATGTAAAAAACALLVQRLRTGAGGTMDVAMADEAHGLAAARTHGLTATGGLLGGALPQYGVYATRSGWIAIAALEPAFLQRLAAGLALDEVTVVGLRRAFRERTAAEWAQWGREHDVPIVIVA